MSDTDLTQAEADRLRTLDKRRVDNREWRYPGLGGGISIPLVSTDGREQFILDVRRGRVNLAKGSYQNRGRRVAVLARLCFGGPPHMNPDGLLVGNPHIHLYVEGYGDKWAYPLPESTFPDLEDARRLFDGFQRYCRVVDPPRVTWGLFA